MVNAYERVAATAAGARGLAGSRLRYEVLKALHGALSRSGRTQSELAARLGIRKSAVNQVLRGDGNVRVTTLAEYLQALGFELVIGLVKAGEPRKAATDDRRPRFVGEGEGVAVPRPGGWSDIPPPAARPLRAHAVRTRIQVSGTGRAEWMPAEHPAVARLPARKVHG